LFDLKTSTNDEDTEVQRNAGGEQAWCGEGASTLTPQL